MPEGNKLSFQRQSRQPMTAEEKQAESGTSKAPVTDAYYAVQDTIEMTEISVQRLAAVGACLSQTATAGTQMQKGPESTGPFCFVRPAGRTHLEVKVLHTRQGELLAEQQGLIRFLPRSPG